MLPVDEVIIVRQVMSNLAAGAFMEELSVIGNTPQVLFATEIMESRIGKLSSHPFFRPVCGTVIRDDDLKIRIIE